MILKTRLLIGLTVLLAVGSTWGCSKPKDGEKTAVSTTTAGTNTANSRETTGGGEKTGPDLSAIPAELKHEGYQYYGLGSSKTIEFEVVRSNSPTVLTGTSSTKFVSMRDGAAVFIGEKTGELAKPGAEEVELRKDGIYNTKIGEETVKPHQLVLPAGLPVGKTWSTDSSVDMPAVGGVYSEKVRYKVVGHETVKTKAGTFDAIKIVGTGNIKIGPEETRANLTAWFVKDIGSVKLTVSMKGKQSGTTTMEATKVN